MHKNKVKRSIIALILLVVALFFIAGTYARYSTTGSANAKANVANWNVSIKRDNTDLTQTTQDIVFTVEPNEYVVSNKIAPATRATAQIEVDLTGTEVAVDLKTVFDSTQLSNVISSNSKISFTTTVDGTSYTSNSPIYIPLVNDSAFTESNGKKTLTIAIEWENDDENNALDTAVGTATQAERTISIPVTLTAQQHIN